jgi:hypothetical protein
MEEAARASKCLFASTADDTNVIACPQRLRYIQLEVARALWGDEVIDGAVHSPERGSSGLKVACGFSSLDRCLPGIIVVLTPSFAGENVV